MMARGDSVFCLGIVSVVVQCVMITTTVSQTTEDYTTTAYADNVTTIFQTTDIITSLSGTDTSVSELSSTAGTQSTSVLTTEPWMNMTTEGTPTSDTATSSTEPFNATTEGTPTSDTTTSSAGPSNMTTEGTPTSNMTTSSTEPSNMTTEGTPTSNMTTSSAEPSNMTTEGTPTSDTATSSAGPSNMTTEGTPTSNMTTSSAEPSNTTTEGTLTPMTPSSMSSMSSLSTDRITTSPPTEPTPAKVGPLPEPTFPEITDGSAEKTYVFEVAVIEDSAHECNSSNLTSPDCEVFKANFTQQLEGIYSLRSGFTAVRDVTLRAGSIIVNHKVVFNYNEMSSEDRMGSAQALFDETLGIAISAGNLGNYTLVDCDSCQNPRETSTICDSAVECPDYSKAECRDNYWVCESVCDTEYCNGHGICWQEDFIEEPTCSCDWSVDHWYWGYECQFYANQLYLIIGCSCGGAVLLLLLIVLVICVCRKPNSPRDELDRPSSETGEVINAFQNYGFSHTEIFPPIEDLNEGDIVSRQRPYSYIHKNPVNSDQGAPNTSESPVILRNKNGVAQKDLSSRPGNEDPAKRQSNSSSDRNSAALKVKESDSFRGQEFWGNLAESNGEHVPLKPMLDHIDISESYKIQRPRISYQVPSTAYEPHGNRTTSDRPQSFAGNSKYNFPEPDYGQR